VKTQEQVVNSITALVQEQRFTAAIDMAAAYLRALPPPDADCGSINYSFENLEEFLFFIARDKEQRKTTTVPEKNIAWLNTQASAISRMQAFALIELGRYDEAIAVLRQALNTSNPIGISLRFELVEAYLKNNQLHLAENELALLSTMVVSLPCIAKYYRRLGYCMIEQEKFLDARACLLYSLCFEKNEKALGELAYLDNLLGNPWGYESRLGQIDSFTFAASLRLYAESAKKHNLTFISTKAQRICLLLLRDAYTKAGKTNEMDKWMDTINLWSGFAEETEGAGEHISSTLH